MVIFLFLQKVKRDDKKIPRYGITASKKIGKAVERNRAKRRMRALISIFLKEISYWFDDTSTYILIAKKSLIKASFLDLKDEMKECLDKL